MKGLILIGGTREENQGLRKEDQEKRIEWRNYC